MNEPFLSSVANSTEALLELRNRAPPKQAEGAALMASLQGHRVLPFRAQFGLVVASAELSMGDRPSKGARRRLGSFVSLIVGKAGNPLPVAGRATGTLCGRRLDDRLRADLVDDR